MADRSIADQELFLPSESQSTSHSQPQNTASAGHQPRFYEHLNDNPAPDSAHFVNDPIQSGIPTFNVIEPTPNASRSSTVRTNASHSTEPKVMTGALPELTEEDNLYDAPTTGPSYPTVPQQTPYQTNAPPPPSTQEPFDVPPEASSHAAPSAPYPDSASRPSEPWSSQPVQDASFNAPHSEQPSASQPWASEPYPGTTPGTDYPAPTSSEPWEGSSQQAPQVPPHPPTYDEYKASRTDQPPPLPGSRPPIPTSDYHAEASSSSAHPAVHLDADQDYALALQLQEEEEGQAPPLPQRPARPSTHGLGASTALSSHNMSAEEQDRALAMRLQEEEDSNAPALPVRPGQQSSGLAPQGPKAFTRTPSTERFLPPPRRQATDFGRDDPADPIHYTRDPHKLIAYLVPFPTPALRKAPSDAVPKRFLIYTPPPPPLKAPVEGVKEDKAHKVQRKWQDEVRRAKLSEAKTTSWAGFRSKLTRGVSKAMTYTTTSNVDFLSRVTPSGSPPRTPSPSHEQKGNGEAMFDEDPAHQSHETKKTVGVEEMVFVYSPSMNLTPDQMREEFVNTVLRAKSKAMRDSVIATGLLPVSLAVDIVLIAVSGLFEVNAAWAYFNIKGAKAARSVSKRLSSSTAAADTVDPGKPEAEMQKEEKLRLDFKPATRIDVLARYLQAECHKVDPNYFPEFHSPPTESDCLEAIGWSPHQTGGQKNWEDEAWELNEVKEDLRTVIPKAAKEWRGYCHSFEKNPEKNLNK